MALTEPSLLTSAPSTAERACLPPSMVRRQCWHQHGPESAGDGTRADERGRQANVRQAITEQALGNRLRSIHQLLDDQL